MNLLDNTFYTLGYTGPQNIVTFYSKGVDPEHSNNEPKVGIIYNVEIRSDLNQEEFTIHFKEIYPNIESSFCYVKARYKKNDNSIILITDFICVDPSEIRNCGIGTFLLNKIIVWAKKFKNASVLPIWIKDIDRFTELRKSFYNKFGLESEFVEKGKGFNKLYTKQIDVSELKEYDLNVNSTTKMYIEESFDEYVKALHQKLQNYVAQHNNDKEKNDFLSKQNKHLSEENKKLSQKFKCYKNVEFIFNIFRNILLIFILTFNKLLSLFHKSKRCFSVNLTLNLFFIFSIFPVSCFLYKFSNAQPIVVCCCSGSLAVNFGQILLRYRRFNHYFDNYISFNISKILTFKFDYLSRFLIVVNLVCSYETIRAVINGSDSIVTSLYFLILLFYQLLLLDINYQN